ncbi:Peptidoglycan/LPS O-acetylase OafA/YrhL, contains acyltransferase and SGNH-hydrolase domains [Geodermatophilus pulveris]|uniref:Peptidoglycan/LPS O-acetylase OafA/YrhL, contains acyltransferase and SGNH-hydrolase domains n=1 Tax=Geodermatophilus pulveris TaxID=1564159 RepID=A0A239AYM8_9ACTN|nr:acyltransferase [Geodermatophilus pulveris]SNS00737.1 Peptidoglycan/LPS O-acetylase OafA/YrhL, contains acyltransferase and SGNH-hydrolase domains [Geodermatophilus pulveris]
MSTPARAIRPRGESPSGTGPAATGEIRSLTGLRAVAATWVVLYHFSFTPGVGYDGYWEPLRPVIRAGATGVDLFFVLSGFVITLTYLERVGRTPSVRQAGTFLWARICRIWPVYAVVTAVYGAWLVAKATQVTDGNVAYQTVQPVLDVGNFLLQFTLVQLWWHPASGGESWMGSAWSISAEWLAYVAFPLVALLLWRIRNAPLVLLGATAVAVMVPLGYTTYVHGGPVIAWSWLLRIGAAFVAGALTCLVVRRIRRTPRVEQAAASCALAATGAVAVGLWWGDWRGIDNDHSAFGGIVVVFFPVLVGALALSRTGLSGLLSRDALVHGGRISFGLYLVHIPVFEVFWTLMGWWPKIAVGTSLWALLLVPVLLSTFVLAHLAHVFVEEPARLRLRRLWPQQQRPAVVPVRAAATLAGPRLPGPRVDTPLAVASAQGRAARSADATAPVPDRRAGWLSA